MRVMYKHNQDCEIGRESEGIKFGWGSGNESPICRVCYIIMGENVISAAIGAGDHQSSNSQVLCFGTPDKFTLSAGVMRVLRFILTSVCSLARCNPPLGWSLDSEYPGPLEYSMIG